jgi:hypothetical protein
MSTSNVQNLLANVLRPVYTYNETSMMFETNLEISNIGTYYGDSINVQTQGFGDAHCNVYAGSNAGRTAGDLGGFNNVAVGYDAANSILNSSNSTYIGFNTSAGLCNASNVVAVGANSIGGGTSNVFLGNNTGGSGQSNVFVGTSNTGTGSNMILIGTAIAGGSSNNLFRLGSNYLYGNQSNKWLGIGTPTASSAKLDVSGATQSSLGFSSVTGTIANADVESKTTIGTIRKGVILVSAQDTASTSHYQSIQVYCPFASDGVYNVAMTNSAQLGELTVEFPSGLSDIIIYNTTQVRNISWSITYFPLP